MVAAAASASTSATRSVPRGERDLRLDFFRGLALIFIFFNHVPNNSLSWLTNRSWGFSDATEIFVFVSGYSAVLAYGGVAERQSYMLATVRIFRRVWQLYAAHMLLFLAFVAQIAYLSDSVGNPMFNEEMAILDFIRDPHVTIVQALLLKFRPVNMDVLPLYIVLLAALPGFLWALKRYTAWVLALSAAIYAVAWFTKINLPAWPMNHAWYFNPFAWQLLFVLGGIAASRPDLVHVFFRWHRVMVPLAVLYLIFSLLIVQTWNFPSLEVLTPNWVERSLYPIDKTDLDLLRMAHFLAAAYLVVLLTPHHAGFLRWPLVQPLIACGRHSLYVFCVGIFLSFTGHFVLVEVSDSLPAQVLVSIAGVALMVGLAYFLDWNRRLEGSAARGRAK